MFVLSPKPSILIGYASTGCADLEMVLPLIIRRVVGVVALEVTVMDFCHGPPCLPIGLYVTVMLPFCPGSIGVFVQLGVVHPQEALTLLITNGVAPSLVNSNTVVTLPSASFMVPKS